MILLWSIVRGFFGYIFLILWTLFIAFSIFILGSFKQTKIVNIIIYAWVSLPLKILGIEVKSFGRENLPRQRGAIFVFNHQSIFDILAVHLVTDIQIRFGAKIELFKILKQKLFSFKNLRYFFRNIKTFKKFSNPEFGKNKHRLMRAIEVVTQIGYIPPLVKIERFNREEYDVKIISTNLPREVLREKIYKRILDRLDAGMIEEIVNVKAKYNLSYKYLEGLGLEFKWISKFLKQEITKKEMIEKLSTEICQYAKRQDTWFRRYRQNNCPVFASQIHPF